ncbi:MAG: ribonuclease P protein component [Ignavibacteria bacterium]|nr:ribonuclease P protein component [Ignavibacteria bacterium]
MDINYKLPKKEILRGFRIYSKILHSSINFSCNNVRVFFKIEKDEDKINKTPKFRGSPIKFGILISRKKIPKAVKRNRLKRLIREAYRLNKNILSGLLANDMKLSMIFSLTDIGYERFINTKNFKLQLILEDIQFLLKKIKKYLNKELID